ncbi:MAG: hypothetical protein HFF60_10775 [Oscillospiraceae bacterium]|nr:hypothetical protein [Oscillospiraceae bacterium]
MLRKGVFRFDRLTVTPGMSGEGIECLQGVRRVTADAAVVYLLGVRWAERPWGLQITAREGAVEELRLQRRESAGLEETFFEQNRLLTERLGAESESGLGRRGWHFPWGSVTSLLDGKTGECVIWAEYLREQL